MRAGFHPAEQGEGLGEGTKGRIGLEIRNVSPHLVEDRRVVLQAIRIGEYTYTFDASSNSPAVLGPLTVHAWVALHIKMSLRLGIGDQR
jgi:hypothetical protein